MSLNKSAIIVITTSSELLHMEAVSLTQFYLGKKLNLGHSACLNLLEPNDHYHFYLRKLSV